MDVLIFRNKYNINEKLMKKILRINNINTM